MPVQPEAESERKDVRQWRQKFVRLAYRFLWDWDDAEDAVHDAFALAEKKRGQISDESKWWPWVARIVINRCKDLRRRQAYQAGQRHDMPTPDNRNADALDAAELGELLKNLIHELPERQQTAIVLRHLENMEYADIAALMEISESTVRGHVLAGRNALREMITKRYPEWAME